ncbi:MAG: DUF2341 domain-containing protein [Thermoplasmata archaeon]|nr:MAG: DUF2341 domain-containing protein [Thermoplasmata archaeon]
MSGFAFGYWADGYDFQYRKDITIDSSKIDAALGYFPVLVKLTSSNIDFSHFLHGTNDGYDIRFSDSIDGNGDADGAILDYEKERFEKGNEKAEIWVEIPSIPSSPDTTFYMFYGHATCLDGEDINGTWDEGPDGSPVNNFVKVLHLKELPTGAPDDIKDSTSFGNHGTTEGTMDANDSIEAKIGKGLTLDGIDDCIRVSDSLSLDGVNDAGTFEIWINWTQAVHGTEYQVVMESSNNHTGSGLEWASQPSGNHYFYPSHHIGFNYNLGPNPFTDQVWQYLVVTLEDTGLRDVNIHVDLNAMSFTEEGVPTNWTELATIDDWIWGQSDTFAERNFLGGFDEIRVSDVVRSAAWIKASYHSGNDTLLTIPTLVELSYLRATSLDSAVLLEWATETELDNAGFNIWRSEDRDGDYVRINPYFIPGEGDAGFGAEYSLTDYNVTNGVIYYYKLEEIDIYGKSTFHGPVPAIPHDIIPILPNEGEKLHSGALLFSWASSSNYSFKVEISPNPSFPASETLAFPEEEWISANSFWLTPREWEMVLRKIQQSGGLLFWRVKTKNEDETVIYNKWRRFFIEDPKVTEK